MKQLFIISCSVLALMACRGNKKTFDASGTFESVETIVPAEASGTLKAFKVEEGKVLKAGEVLGYIDSLQLYLKKKQIEAQITALLSKRPDIPAQVAAAREQLSQTQRELKRMENLFQKEAATQKQLDDARSANAIAAKQLSALESSLGISSNSINKEVGPLQMQLEQLEDQLQKCRIVNPMEGTVLTKYAEVYEMATPGKPLYKIASLQSLLLRAYVTESQFAAIKLGQNVKVFIDANAKESKEYQGTIEWISDKAEFTPKTIQTKDERANLVYAIKVRVKNDGLLKIGMYGELNF